MTASPAKRRAVPTATETAAPLAVSAPAVPPESPVHHLAERYLAWTAAALHQLGELAGDGAGPDHDAEAAAEKAYGILHDLKGSGVLFGYDLMTHIADSGCALVRGQSAIDPARREALRQHVDAMKLVMARRIAGNGGDAGRRLLAKLAGLRTRTYGPG